MRKDTPMRKTLARLLRRAADRLCPDFVNEPNHWTWTGADFVVHFDHSASQASIKRVTSTLREMDDTAREIRRELYLSGN